MFLNKLKNKKLIAFGAGSTLKIANKKKRLNHSYLIDNNSKLLNKKFAGLKVYNPSIVKNEKNFLIIIYSPRFYEIKLQLENLGLNYNKHFIHFSDLSFYKNLMSHLSQETCYTNLDYILKPGDVCLDVGANIGLYTYKMSKLVKKKGKVLSFEPVNIAYKQIKLIKKKYNLNNCKIFNFALGHQKKDTEMLIPIKNNLPQLGFSHVNTIKYQSNNTHSYKYKKSFFYKMNFGYKQKTKIELIDFIIPRYKLKKIDYIKIDVEGYEINVIKGAFKTIKKYRPIIQSEIFYSKKNQTKMFKFFKSIEYCFFYPENKKLIQIHNWKTIRKVSNYYLIPKEKLNILKKRIYKYLTITF